MRTYLYSRSTKLLGTIIAALAFFECRAFVSLSRPVVRSQAVVKPAGHVLLLAQRVDEAESSATTAGCENLECLLARPLAAARSDEDRELLDRALWRLEQIKGTESATRSERFTERLYSDVQKLFPGFATTSRFHTLAAETFKDLGQPKIEAAAFRNAVRWESSPKSYLGLGKCLVTQLGRIAPEEQVRIAQEANGALRTAIMLAKAQPAAPRVPSNEPDDQTVIIADCLSHLALLQDQRDLSKYRALTTHRQAIDLLQRYGHVVAPQDFSTRRNYATTLKRHGHRAEAARQLLVVRRFRRAAALSQLALKLEEKCLSTTKTFAIHRQAMELAPDMQAVHYNYFKTLKKHGYRDEAAKELWSLRHLCKYGHPAFGEAEPDLADLE